MKYLPRILLYILLVAIVLHAGFFALLAIYFNRGDEFYSDLILIVVFPLLLLAFLHLFRLVAAKKMKRIWLLFLSLTFVTCGIHEAMNAYERSFVRIRESGADLGLYKPFEKDTRAVVLDSPSTLKLETDLPALDGATALYPLYSAFAQAVYPKEDYDQYDSKVSCHNTISAYGKLIHKTADIIFVAPPSKEQLDDAQAAGVKFKLQPLGREAFVFFVNSRNPVSDLTVEQLQRIYSGEIKNWKELGGRDEAIRPFQRNEGSGSQTAFVKFMKGKAVMKPPTEDVVGGMEGIITMTADYTNYRNSIGFSFRFYVNEMVKNDEVKILKINGIYPDLETIGNGTYPLAASFYAITLADNKKPNVEKFLAWMLSEQGQSLVRKTGYCPTSQNPAR